MIDVYFWPTGNGKKVTIMLEECGLEYKIIPININQGDQHTPEFKAISPNNKMPAIIDHDAEGEPLAIFESGAILMYLGEKTGKLLPTDVHARFSVMQWVFWQNSGLGPMAGQAHYFLKYAPKKNEEGMRRFREEVARLYGVMDSQLEKEQYLAGEYSIADISAWPWVFRYDWQGQDLNDFPHVKRWFEAVGKRPAVERGSKVGQDLIDRSSQMTDEDKKTLFGLTDEHFAE